MRIYKGKKVILSEKGHNGFFYPGDRDSKILYDSEFSRMSWIGGGSKLTPIAVPENAIYISGNPLKKVIVWVHNEK